MSRQGRVSNRQVLLLAVGLMVVVAVAVTAIITLPSPLSSLVGKVTETRLLTTTTTSTETREKTSTQTTTTIERLTFTNTTTYTTIKTITSTSKVPYNITTTSVLTKTVGRNITITSTTTYTVATLRNTTFTTTTTVTNTTTKTTTITSTITVTKSPSSGYLYTALLTSPGRLVQVDLDTFTVKLTITLSSAPHVVAADADYVYVGTLSKPGRVIKVKVPEMVESGSIGIPEGPLMWLSVIGGTVYACPTDGSIIEIDTATMTRGRTLTISGATEVHGVLSYGGYLYASTSLNWQAPGYLVKIDPPSFTEVGRIQLPTPTGQDIQMRHPFEVNGLIYILANGPSMVTRIFEVDPASLTVKRWKDISGSSGADRFAYDGRYLYWNNDDVPSRVVRFDPATFQYNILSLSGVNRASDVDISGRYLYVTNYAASSILTQVDLSTFTQVQNIPLGAGNGNSIQSVVVK